MAKRVGIISRYRQALKSEAFAGIVLMIAALAAIVWSNSPWRGSYFAISEKQVGLESVHLSLPIGHWASDGLLAVFFFVVGMELKQEFTIGSLRDPRKAAVPILAALCGMVGPIGVYIVVQAVTGSGVYGGWAVPVATDIAFALAILAIFGRGLPPAARTFLMTLAVADDLGGIVVIALFFSTELNLLWLGASIATVAVFGLLIKYRVIRWWILWPLGILAWYFMHLSGIHSTIAGVALGMMVSTKLAKGEKDYMTHRFSERLSFASSGIVLPIFAFFAAGVNIVDSGGFGGMITDPVSLGIYLGLPLGKCIGIFGGVWIMTKFLKLRLGAGIDMRDIFPISLVAGIGFTVSLLIATLSFPANDPHEPHSRVAVIIGTLLSVVLGAVALRLRLRSAIRGPGIDPHSHLRHAPNRREDGPRRDGIRGDRRGRRPKP
ncbi:MAG: Na+/H+ antiporter NhaA [Peptidiphaga gingivicola]